VLKFERAVVQHLPLDQQISELEGSHLEHGDPACSVVRVRWTNVPNVDQPSFIVVQGSS
jgi:hypothetical protein